jgi:hypothetical protein
MKNAQLDWIKCHYGKTPQSTARIDRITCKALISRYFLRSVLLLVIARPDKYRPRIACLEMSRLAGLSRPR